MPEARQYRFGPYLLDPSRRLLTRGSDPVPLTARAFDVLLVLIEQSGRTVEKDELLRRVWPDTVVEEANLSQQIFTIRKLLRHSDDDPYIATVPRRGYRFVAPVAEIGAPAASTPLQPPSAERPPLRLAIPVEHAELALGAEGVVAVTPDGSAVVFAASHGGTPRLFLRRLSDFHAAEIPGTEGASHPFLSPDGSWVGFHARRRLQKVALAGGPPVALADVADLRGAAWSPSGVIVFAPAPTSGLWQIAESGGAATPLTTVDHDAGERTHRWPHALPDGRGIVFTVGHAGAASFDEASLAVGEIGRSGHRLILQHATDGRYVPAGRLMWARGGVLLAADFDEESRRVESPARPVQSGVATAATGVAHFAVSASGTLVHVPGHAQSLRQSLVAVDRSGKIAAHHVRGEALEEPRVAPDGRSVIVSLRGRTSDLWRYEFARGALARVTFEGENFAGVWGPRAGMLTFSSSRGGGPSDLYVVQTDRPAAPELLVASEFDKAAGSWLHDGSTLVFTEYHPDTGADLWILDAAAERARPFVRTQFNEYAPAFSPDGRYIAYTTDESGRPEIQLVSYPDATGKRQLSTEGGAEPVWSRDDRELFYRRGDRLMRVDMSRGPEEAGIPVTVFEGKYVTGTVTLANYDISADGTHFLIVQADAAAPPAAFFVTIGWTPDRLPI